MLKETLKDTTNIPATESDVFAEVLENHDLLLAIMLFLPFTTLTKINEVNKTFKTLATHKSILKHHIRFLAPWFDENKDMQTATLKMILRTRLAQYRNAEKTQLYLTDKKRYEEGIPSATPQDLANNFYHRIYDLHKTETTDRDFKRQTQDLLGCFYSFVTPQYIKKHTILKDTEERSKPPAYNKIQKANKLFTLYEEETQSCLAQSGIAQTTLLLIKPNLELTKKIELFNTAVTYLNKSLKQAFMFNNIFSIYATLGQIACKLHQEIKESKTTHKDMHQDRIEYDLGREEEIKLRRIINESNSAFQLFIPNFNSQLATAIQELYEKKHQTKIQQASERIQRNFGTAFRSSKSGNNTSKVSKK